MTQWLGLWGRKNGFAQRVGVALPIRPASTNSKQRCPHIVKRWLEGTEAGRAGKTAQKPRAAFWNWLCGCSRDAKEQTEYMMDWSRTWTLPFFAHSRWRPVWVWTAPEGGGLAWSPPWDTALGKQERQADTCVGEPPGTGTALAAASGLPVPQLYWGLIHLSLRSQVLTYRLF